MSRRIVDETPVDNLPPRHAALLTLYLSVPLTRRKARHYAIEPTGALAFADMDAETFMQRLLDREVAAAVLVLGEQEVLLALRPLRQHKEP